MSRKFVITAERNVEVFSDVVMADTVKSYQFDFSPWAEDNATITSVTWSVEAGNASVAGQALASNVASARVTCADAGQNLIKISGTTGTLTHVAYLHIKAKEPFIAIDDYGLSA